MQTSISKEKWAEIETKLKGRFPNVKFKYKGKEISINRESESEGKTVLVVYIDGYIKGIWFQLSDEDLIEPLTAEVWRQRKRARHSPVAKKKLIKGLSKKLIKEFFPDLDKVTIYYSPYFNTSRSLCSQFKKLKDLTLVEKEVTNV